MMPRKRGDGARAPRRPRVRRLRGGRLVERASGDDDESGDDVPRANPLEQLWLRLVKPLRDFGFGRTNIWEGGVGLFLIGGAGMAALTWSAGSWASTSTRCGRTRRSWSSRSRAASRSGRRCACAGVKVGRRALRAPQPRRVEVLVEMDDDGIVIPRNSLVEANQSGLITETIIDITPEIPIPKAQWGPLDSG